MWDRPEKAKVVGQTELAELIQKASEEERKEREGEAYFFDSYLVCGVYGGSNLARSSYSGLFPFTSCFLLKKFVQSLIIPVMSLAQHHESSQHFHLPLGSIQMLYHRNIRLYLYGGLGRSFRMQRNIRLVMAGRAISFLLR